MSRANLTALIERVEAARGPDQELDAESATAAGWRDVHRAAHLAELGQGRLLGWPPEGSGAWAFVPAFTASLDAAATLVPEGWAWDVRRMYPGGSVHGAHHTGEAHLDRWSDRDFRTEGAKAFVRVTAATPALALTAAALRATLASMGDDA
jgi:hypothetical protein